MPATAVDPVLRPAQAAEALGIARSTLTRWRQRDDFPKALTLGPGAVGFRRSDIENWLASRPEA